MFEPSRGSFDASDWYNQWTADRGCCAGLLSSVGSATHPRGRAPEGQARARKIRHLAALQMAEDKGCYCIVHSSEPPYPFIGGLDITGGAMPLLRVCSCSLWRGSCCRGSVALYASGLPGFLSCLSLSSVTVCGVRVRSSHGCARISHFPYGRWCPLSLEIPSLALGWCCVAHLVYMIQVTACVYPVPAHRAHRYITRLMYSCTRMYTVQ